MTTTQIRAGVATGDALQAIFELAKARQFALPAVNVISTNTVNAVMETAAELNSPVIIQFSNGGAHVLRRQGAEQRRAGRRHRRRGLRRHSTSTRWPRCTAPA